MIYHLFEPLADVAPDICTCGKPRTHHLDQVKSSSETVKIEVQDIDVVTN